VTESADERIFRIGEGPATAVLLSEKDQEKRSRFVNTAPGRTRAVLKALRVLGNCSNRSSYSFTEDEAAKVIYAVGRAVEELNERFREPPKASRLEDTFEL
jgi:hypothetical protein